MTNCNPLSDRRFCDSQIVILTNFVVVSSVVIKRVVCIYMANSVDPDQTLHSLECDLGLHHLQRPICRSLYITKTYLYNIDPLKPHFYVVKLGYTLFFLFLLKNIDCGYSLEPPRRGGSNEYPQSMF